MMITLPQLPEQQSRKSFVRGTTTRNSTVLSNYYFPSSKQKARTSILHNSKNLFTTVLKEEREEIVEEGFTMTDLTPNTSTLTPRKPRTLPELNRMSSTQYSELVEENTLRERKVDQYIRELKKFLVSQGQDQNHIIDIRCQYRDRKSNIELRDKILKIGENILNLYNIRYHPVEMTTEDSLMKIEKIRDKFLLSRCLQIVVNEVRKFPYSFFKKIGFTSLTFCERIDLYKDITNPMVNKKLLSGIFSLTHFQSDEDVIDNFYKIIFSRLKEHIEDLDNNWAKVYVKKSKTIMNISMNIVVSESTKMKKNFFEEQWRYFKELITKPNSALKHESNIIRVKAFKLKDSMETLDVDGIDDAWWKKRGFTLQAGSLNL